MEQKVIVHLTDDEYTTFAKQAEQTGQDLETIVHEVLHLHLTMNIQRAIQANRPRSKQEIAELLFDEGLIEHIPSGRMLSEEEVAERKRLADFFGQVGGQLASEMVIEDRGPY